MQFVFKLPLDSEVIKNHSQPNVFLCVAHASTTYDRLENEIFACHSMTVNAPLLWRASKVLPRLHLVNASVTLSCSFALTGSHSAYPSNYTFVASPFSRLPAAPHAISRQLDGCPVHASDPRVVLGLRMSRLVGRGQVRGFGPVDVWTYNVCLRLEILNILLGIVGVGAGILRWR